MTRLGRLLTFVVGARGGRGSSPAHFQVADARRLADAERALGESPAGCAWLDDRTVDDLDVPLVFRTIDRTRTPTGAQVLWRWLVAPAVRLDVLAEREAELVRLTDRSTRSRVRAALGHGEPLDAPHLPQLLWTATPPAFDARLVYGLLAALVGCCVLAVWWPKLIVVAALVFFANVLVDDWANLRVAQRASALAIVATQLGIAARVVTDELAAPAVRAELAADLAGLSGLRKRLRVLALRDPFGIMDLVRAGLLVRLVVLGSCGELVHRERARLRRVVIRLGELDAAAATAELRAERDDTAIPELQAIDTGGARGAPRIVARDLVHPAVVDAIGNDVTLADGGLVVTGSNMSGKSTFLRAVAINAICAQSIHTTFGRWQAPLLRVVAVMRIVDDTERGMSKYAIEVAAIGAVVAAASPREASTDAAALPTLPALIVVDEPFGGTNPAVRVSIVVSVLEYLGARDLVIAATHDLEVAAQLGARFARGYFAELAGTADEFDRRLRAGVSPATNAVELLAHAGYPIAILDDVARLSSRPRERSSP